MGVSIGTHREDATGLSNKFANSDKRPSESTMNMSLDITGWRKELDELRSGPAYKTMYPKPIWDPKDDPLVPLSAVVDYVDTLLSNSETRSAIRAIDDWYKANPLKGDSYNTENEPTFPHREHQLLINFANWYMLKTGFGPRFAPYLAGWQLATQVLNEAIPNSHSQPAREFLVERARIHIDPSK